MKNVIDIQDLVKKYDDTFQLGKFDLQIPCGCVVGLIGENGAGKTTLIKSILDIIQIDEGSIQIFDLDYQKDASIIKKDIGVVLDNTFFPELLNAKDIERVMEDIYDTWDHEIFIQYLKQFDLPSDRPLKSMSKGMRKKLEIATALSHHPKLLILDEPTSGLDPVVRSQVLDIFLDFMQDEEHTILFSTHITSDLEHIADMIIFLDQGSIVLENMRDDILDGYGILKCSISEFSMIAKEDIVRYKKNKYGYEVLVMNRRKISQKYKDFILDKITLEELMVLMIKGEKSCVA